MNARLRTVLARCSQGPLLGLALGIWTWPDRALAQGVDEFGPYGREQERKDYESPQHWAFELRIGPYYPQVDEEFNGAATPLADTLNSTHRVMVGIEGDWQAYRLPKILSLGPGVGMGYTVLSKTAEFRDPPPGVADMNTTLKVWVQWADLVARIDALNRNFRIPIVFSAKVGIGHALWWAGKGDLAGRDRLMGTIGHGRSWGPHWALGVMVDLNFVQPERARRLDAISDINHMYVFFEWYQLKLGSFGGDQMHVGDSDWALGYALEF
jgi:hypothetical protein